MSYLIIVRHGQSKWNAQKKFTGWVDVGLTAKGKLEACKSGELIKEINVKIDNYFSSYQKRAINTLELIMNIIRIKPNQMIKAWELNERHYGELTGLNKDEMKKKYGDKKIHSYRRSWKIAPPSLNKNNPYHPINIDAYKNVPREKIPDTESLKDTYDRTVPYYKRNIENLLMKKKNIIIAAHGNSLRALCKKLFNISDQKINELEIPTGNPLLIEFDQNLEVKDIKYLDKSREKPIITNQ